jgi:hypothetical protein
MARRRARVLLGTARAALLGVVVLLVLTSCKNSRDSIDPGGGPVAGPTATPEPFAISTLPPVGRAAQDPGGGGGGNGPRPGAVGPPGIIGPLGGGSVDRAGLGDFLYFSGVNLLDPNRSATTSGENTFPSPLSPLGGLGPITDPLGGLLGGSATGCATTPDSVDYYAVPLTIEHITFSGTPQVHLRISGAGPVNVRLYQQQPDESCSLITSGSGTISGGVADLSLGPRSNFQFAQKTVPALVVQAPGTHTISTSRENPSYLELPNLTGT